jgi:hypothetical protein
MSDLSPTPGYGESAKTARAHGIDKHPVEIDIVSLDYLNPDHASP